MIKLKVEVFEQQLKQESTKQSNLRENNTTRQSDEFWMTKLLETSNCIDSKKSKSQLKHANGMCRDTVINSIWTRKASAIKMAINYDNQRKVMQDITSSQKKL
jgi:hypothetical protein